MIPVCLTGLVWLRGQAGRHARWMLPLATLLWIAEQVRWQRPELRRSAEYAKFAVIPPVPRDCRAFYVVGSNEDWRIANVDAMMMAIRDGRPTLNGNSGYFPPGFPGLDMTGDYSLGWQLGREGTEQAKPACTTSRRGNGRPVCDRLNGSCDLFPLA